MNEIPCLNDAEHRLYHADNSPDEPMCAYCDTRPQREEDAFCSDPVPLKVAHMLVGEWATVLDGGVHQ